MQTNLYCLKQISGCLGAEVLGMDRLGGITKMTKIWVDMFTLVIMVMFSKVYSYIKSQFAHFKYVHFIVCQLLFNKVVIKSQQGM